MSSYPYITSLNYSDLIRWRGECQKRFGTIHEIRIADKGIYGECRKVYKGGTVLDIGAGVDQPFRKILNVREEDYFTVDSDTEGTFTYRKMDEIPKGSIFSFAVLNQVLEHLTVDDGYRLLVALHPLLADGGLAAISVPNAHHPFRYHSTVTHVTNWPFGDLYGLIRHTGYEVLDLVRTNKSRPSRNPIRRWILQAVCQDLRIDWCDSILFIAQKTPAS